MATVTSGTKGGIRQPLLLPQRFGREGFFWHQRRNLHMQYFCGPLEQSLHLSGAAEKAD
jgi:hypothetical protein